ncbi:MAG TPA: glycosyltransferase, partial [Brevibacterium sp.]|nr:glycosyltransferase [Brevibacterium sp.]
VEPSLDSGTPLRVLHLVTNSLPHTQSGYAVRTHNILTALRQHGIESLALTRTGYPVMIGKPFCGDEDVVDGIRYRRTLPPSLGATPQGRLEQEVDEAIHLVEEFRPHVLHATTDFRNALVAQAVSAATGIPWVLEVRGLLEKTWIASHRSPEGRARAAESEKVARIAAAEARLARQAGAVVTLSRTMAEVLRDRGVRAENITLVPNGVDSSLLDEELSPAQARARIDSPLPADALAVGAVSALVDYEGFDTLLRAVAALLQGSLVPEHVRDRLHVVLVGDGVSAPALSKLARELGIADRLHIPGRVPRDRARDWVQALDVVVVPRRDLEVSRTVTPQKPIEAMALARPVVVSDLPALRETVENSAGEAVGVLVPPDDSQALGAALAALLADPARRAALGAAGRAAAAERTWAAMMGRYEGAYRAVLGGGS